MSSLRPSVRFLRFCIVGASGVLTNLLTFRAVKALLDPVGLGDTLHFELAHVAGILVSILTNFLFNNYWTWAGGVPCRLSFRQRLFAFYGVSFLGGLVQLVVAGGVRLLLPGANEIAVLIGIAAATSINFLANDRFTFRISAD